MEKKLRLERLRVDHFRLILAFVAILFLIPGILMFWWASERTEKIITDRVKDREETLARAGALLISDFFEERKIDLLVLTEIESVKKGEEGGRGVSKTLVSQLKGKPLAGLVRVDSQGKSLWSENSEQREVEEKVDLSDQEYFLWAKSQKGQGGIFVSNPFISHEGLTEGEWVVVMATPVFYQDKFSGLVFFSFRLSDLTEKFVTPLSFSADVQAMIFESGGVVIASTLPEAKSQNALEAAKEARWTDKEEYLQMVQAALEGKEGSMVHNYYFTAPFDKPTRMLTAFAPIKIDSQTWSLWVSVPYDKVISFASPLRTSQIRGFALGLIGALVLVFVFLLGIRVAQRDGFLDGYVRAKDGLKKK